MNWRRQREQGELVAGRARKRGPTPKPVDPRVKQLEVENRRLQRKLARAETIITLQLWDRSRNTIDEPFTSTDHALDLTMRRVWCSTRARP